MQIPPESPCIYVVRQLRVNITMSFDNKMVTIAVVVIVIIIIYLVFTNLLIGRIIKLRLRSVNITLLFQSEVMVF